MISGECLAHCLEPQKNEHAAQAVAAIEDKEWSGALAAATELKQLIGSDTDPLWPHLHMIEFQVWA